MIEIPSGFSGVFHSIRSGRTAAGFVLRFAPLVAVLASGHAAGENAPHLPEDPTFTIHAEVLQDGALLAYYVRPGPGPTVVLLPGTLGDHHRFIDSALTDRIRADLQVVIVEARGQGRSWPPPTPAVCSIEQYATDVLEVIDAIRPNRWFVGGHSLGGMISIEIAGRKPRGLCGVISLEGWPHYTVQAQAFPDFQPGRPTGPPGAPENWRELHRIAQRWTVEEQKMLVTIWKKWTPGRQILQDTDYPVLTIWGDRGMKTRPGRGVLGLPDKRAIEVAWISGSDHYGLVSAAHAGPIADLINEFTHRIATSPSATGVSGSAPAR